MPVAIPTLGYDSRTAAAVAFKDNGLSDALIALKIGISAKNVSALIASRSHARAKRPAEVNGLTVLFPNDILNALRPHAARRGMTVNALAREIVDTVVQEGLIDAVLDDEGAI